MRKAVQPFIKRARAQAALRGALKGLWIGAALLCAALLIRRTEGLLILPAAAAIGAALALRKTRDPEPILSKIDRLYDLKDRVRAAYALEKRGASTPMEQAQINDALAQLAAADRSAWIPRLLPRRAWTAPAALLLACSPLILPPLLPPDPPPDAAETISAAELQAVQNAAAALRFDPQTAKRLRRSETLEEAFAHLAEAERRAETAQKTLETARNELKALQADPRQPLSDALLRAAAEPPPELAEQLKALRDVLERNKTGHAMANAAAEALIGVETAAVSPETLRKIAQALQGIERQADALKRIQAEKKKIAAAALAAAQNKAGGTYASSSGAGTDPDRDPSEREIEPLPEHLPNGAEPRSAQLILETLESGAGRQEAVYAVREDAPPGASPELLPFRQVALQAAQNAVSAANAQAIPAAYRARVERYFKAVEAAAQERP